MTIKKMLLLAASAMALVAFAAPAVASADQWYTDPGNVTVTEDHFWLHGHLNATVPALGAELTCDITAHITINNGGGHANVEIDEVVLDAPAAGCHGVFGGVLTCEITAGVAGAGEVHVNGTSLEVTNAFFLNELEGCAATEEAGASGTLTGTFNNATSCVDFANSGDMTVPGLGAAVFVDGSLCDETGTLTLHN